MPLPVGHGPSAMGPRAAKEIQKTLQELLQSSLQLLLQQSLQQPLQELGPADLKGCMGLVALRVIVELRVQTVLPLQLSLIQVAAQLSLNLLQHLLQIPIILNYF